MTKQQISSAKKASAKKRVKKNVERDRAHIQSSSNNTIVMLTDLQGSMLSWTNAGGLGFRGSRKSTPHVASVATETVVKAAIIYGLRPVDVTIKDPGSRHEATIRALSTCGIEVASIRDMTPVPHNGCHLLKRRKV